MNKKILCAAALLLLAGCERKPLEVHSFQRKLMHTQWDFSLVGRDQAAAEKAFKAASDEIERLDGLLAMWQPQSEVAVANRSAGNPGGVTVSAELGEVISLALQAAKVSEGSFDPTVGPLTQAWYDARQHDRALSPAELATLKPLLGWTQVGWDEKNRHLTLPKAGMALDLGGIAKGYAQDRAAVILRGLGFKDFLMNAGGQVYAAGAKPDGKPWRVGILDPRNTEKVACVLELRDEVMATSGDYEQFKVIKGRRLHHILDPRNGEPVSNGIASASSILPLSAGPRAATWADIDGKPVFVKGVKDGLAWLQAQGAEGVVIADDKGQLRAFNTANLHHALQTTDASVAFPSATPPSH